MFRLASRCWIGALSFVYCLGPKTDSLFWLAVLAEVGDLPGAQTAHAEYLERYPDGWSQMGGQTFLRLLGDKKGASGLCRGLAEDGGKRFPGSLSREVQRCAKYNAGDLEDEEFEKGAVGSLWERCLAQHYLGVKKVAAGDRTGALAHFGEAVATRAFLFSTHHLSWAFQGRLKADPTWPKWPPKRK